MGEQLKPCPFCDDVAEFEHSACEASVRCMGCGAQLHRSYNPLVVKSYEEGRKREKADVIAAWNTRLDAAQVRVKPEARCIINFEDNSVPDAHIDNLEDAKRTLNKMRPNWNCRLFVDFEALEPDSVTGWQDIATKLFCALDDIDTADDIAKDNEKLYRNLVRKAHKVRFEFQELFDPDGDVSSFNQPPLPPAPEKEG